MDRLNLQLFAGEKTEKATPRRRKKARQAGQVLKSAELTSAVVLLAGFLALFFSLPLMVEEWYRFSYYLFQFSPGKELNANAVQRLFLEATWAGTKMILPLVGAVMVSGLVANYAQVGFLFTVEPLLPKLDRINPVQGFRRIFSWRSLGELVKSLLKVALFSYLIYRSLVKYTGGLLALPDNNIGNSTVFLGRCLFTLGIQVGVALLALGILDYFFQKWQYERSLRMTKQEVKEELKETEGDPRIRSRIRERQRQMARRRMMQEVPKADVVITNPVHLAVALKYDGQTMAAPVVVAKGQGLLAEKIKEIARQHGVVIVENKPLARALYQSVEVGEEIPPDLYQAVAEVLAFVYRLKKKV